jgi:cholesterol transport system auxiliary component
MKHSMKFILGCLCITLLAGCLKLERNAPVKRFYIIDVTREAPAAEKTIGSTLTVLPFGISPMYNQKSLVYRGDSGESESDFYNQFFTDPSSQISQETREWMRRSGLFENVVDLSSQADTTHVLEGAVELLYGDTSVETGTAAVIELQFLLLDTRTVKPEVIFEKSYERRIRTSSKAPADFIAGWEKGLQEILTEFESDLTKLQ